MTGIIVAMDIEAALLKEHTVGAKTSNVCGMECTNGKIGNSEVVIIKSGIGKAAAASAAVVAISAFGAKQVINTGLAAGKYDIGTIMIADSLVQYDFDMTADGLPMGQSSDFDSAYFKADKTLSNALAFALEKSSDKFVRTNIASGDAFVADAEKMDRICREFGVGGVEMESGALAQVCTRAGIPFAVLRAVSDNGNSVVDYHSFKDKICKVFTDALLRYFDCAGV